MRNVITIKHSAKVINSTASMLLFLLFTICALIMVSIASSTYSKINTGFSDTFDSAASVRYISNKLKGSTDVAIMKDNQTGLILHEDGYNVLIYYKSGGIYETAVAEDVTTIPTAGDLLFNVDALTLTDQGNGVLEISVIDSNSNAYKVYCNFEN